MGKKGAAKWITLLVLALGLSGLWAPAPAERVFGELNPGTTDYPNGGMRHVPEVDVIELPHPEMDLQDLVIDGSGQYAYAMNYFPGRIVRIDLREFERMDALDVSSQHNYLWSATAIDPAGRFLYSGSLLSPGQVARVDLSSFQLDGTLGMDEGENALISALMDPEGEDVYFTTGNRDNPGRLIRVDPETLERESALEFPSGEFDFQAAAIDSAGKYAYLGTGDFTIPSKITTVDLESFERVSSLEIEQSAGQRYGFYDAVISPDDHYVYFCTFHGPGRLVKFNTTSRKLDAEFTLGDSTRLFAGAMGPEGNFAYFTSFPNELIKVDLDANAVAGSFAFQEGIMPSIEIDPSGRYVYTGSNSTRPGKIRRFAASPKGFVNMTKILIQEPTLVDEISMYCHRETEDGAIRLGLYRAGSPGNLVWQSQPLGKSNGPGRLEVKMEQTGTSRLVLDPGVYYLAWQMNTSANVAGYINGDHASGAYFPSDFGNFPDSIPETEMVSTRGKWSIALTGEEFPTPRMNGWMLSLNE